MRARGLLLDGGAREVRALTAARAVARLRVSTSADDRVARPLAVEPQPAVLRPPGGGSSRARATAARGRARTGRGPWPCAAPRSPARCRAGSSDPAAAETAGSSRQPRAVEPLRLAVGDARRQVPVADDHGARRRASASISRLLLVAVGDVQQLHDVRRRTRARRAAPSPISLPIARRRRRGTTSSRHVAPARVDLSRSRSAWVCLPLWSRPSKAIRRPVIGEFDRDSDSDRHGSGSRAPSTRIESSASSAFPARADRRSSGGGESPTTAPSTITSAGIGRRL